jgi:glycopeptide antibiotics resistance protein
MLITDVIPLGAVALVAAVILAVIACVRKKRSFRQTLWLFAVRFAGLWYALAAVTLLFKLSTIGFVPNGSGDLAFMRVNLKPFVTIIEYVNARNTIQIAGNLGVLFPLPILIRLNFAKMSFLKIALISAIVTILIEPLQLLVNVIKCSPYNSIDIDDLILNALGVALGLLIVKAIETTQKHRRIKNVKQGIGNRR